MAAKLGGGPAKPQKAVKLPSKTALKAYVTSMEDLKQQGRECSKEQNELSTKAVKEKHIHKKMAGWAMQLNKMSSVKLHEALAHLMFSIEALELEKKAASQLDLGDDEGDGGEDADGAETGKDVRPRHMTQPGAAPDNVRQLPTKAGAALPSDPDPTAKPH